MSVREELIERILISNDPKGKNEGVIDHNNENKEHKRVFRNLKRKYRVLLFFIIGFILILIMMILPVVIAIFSQNLLY
ncbi:MAG: hypothetical protein ACFFE5_02435 [Candidatus Thorarchaeota archaeon]